MAAVILPPLAAVKPGAGRVMSESVCCQIRARQLPVKGDPRLLPGLKAT